jgi:cytidine deaminase
MSPKDHEHADVVVEHARKYREKAFAPYSEYRVGAALLTEKGIYRGSNVEVSGRSTSVHAEMMAAFNAVIDGVQEFRLLAISQDGENEARPCGLCQHTLAQFTDELPILEDRGKEEEPAEYSLADLIGPAYSPSTQHPETVTR